MLGSKKLEFDFLTDLSVLPPSVKAIYNTLLDGKPLYVYEIASKANYSRRTVQEALRILIDREMVVNLPDFRDLRRNLYTISNN